MTDDSSGKGKGFGFVSFEDPEAAEKVMMSAWLFLKRRYKNWYRDVFIII